jgi:hypothetical protein
VVRAALDGKIEPVPDADVLEPAIPAISLTSPRAKRKHILGHDLLLEKMSDWRRMPFKPAGVVVGLCPDPVNQDRFFSVSGRRRFFS